MKRVDWTKIKKRVIAELKDCDVESEFKPTNNNFIKWAETAPADPEESRYAIVSADDCISWIEVSPVQTGKDFYWVSSGEFYDGSATGDRIEDAVEAAMRHKARSV